MIQTGSRQPARPADGEALKGDDMASDTAAASAGTTQAPSGRDRD